MRLRLFILFIHVYIWSDLHLANPTIGVNESPVNSTLYHEPHWPHEAIPWGSEWKKNGHFQVTAEDRRQVTIGRTCVEPFTKETDLTAVLLNFCMPVFRISLTSTTTISFFWSLASKVWDIAIGSNAEYYNTIPPWRRDKSIWQVCNENFKLQVSRKQLETDNESKNLDTESIFVIFSSFEIQLKSIDTIRIERKPAFFGPPEVGKIWPLCPQSHLYIWKFLNSDHQGDCQCQGDMNVHEHGIQTSLLNDFALHSSVGT